MSLRRAVSALALLLVAGCSGAENEPSSRKSDSDGSIDAVMAQRLEVDIPPRPIAPHPPTREDGVGLASYFFDSLEYAMRSGFAMNFRRDSSPICGRCRAVWMSINDEYVSDHNVQMTPIQVDTVRVTRGPFRRPGFRKLPLSQRQVEPSYWVVEVGYHIDRLSIRDSEGGVLESATDLEFVDRLVVVSATDWWVCQWKSTMSDRDAPLLGGAPPAAA